MDDDREKKIRERAYAIWEREGRPHGRDEENWRLAEDEHANGQDADETLSAAVAQNKPNPAPQAAPDEQPTKAAVASPSVKPAAPARTAATAKPAAAATAPKAKKAPGRSKLGNAG